MNYSDYLQLESVLQAQRPLSDAHDEMLFIIQHQTSELWMRLVVHELQTAREAIVDNHLPVAFKMLTRVSRIFEQLNNAWDVLRTMTPSDYTTFRNALGQSSGFQSWQYRQIEFMLGNRKSSMVDLHDYDDKLVELLKTELHAPSLYDAALRRLHHEGISIPTAVLDRDVTQSHQLSNDVVDAWRVVYNSPEEHWSLYELAEKLVDLEDYFRRWRFNHVTTVERVIGLKPGTGGTGGVSYLRSMLDVVLFPELWQVRTVL